MDFNDEDEILENIQCPYCNMDYTLNEETCEHLLWNDNGGDYYFLEMEIPIPRDQFLIILEKIDYIREGVDGEYYFVENINAFKKILIHELEKEDDLQPNIDIKISIKAENLILKEKQKGENYSDTIIRIFKAFRKS